MASSLPSDSSRPSRTVTPPRVAIIGAGLAGLTLARFLTETGFPVKVFDKGRGPAGRMSTRREDGGGTFDHGAQYFTARDPGFQRMVGTWVEQGLVAGWRGRFGSLEHGTVTPETEGPVRYVGVPGMNAVARQLASGVDLRCGVRVEHVRREAEAWALSSESGEALGTFDVVVAAVPAPQAVPLLSGAPELAARAAGVRMEPCWAVMASFDAPVPLPLDGVFIHGSPLSWAARDSSKPGRPPGERWVIHASPEFTRAHLEETPEAVAPRILEAFARAAGVEIRPREARAHRWRYARAEPALTEGALFDERTGLGACGDWCAGSRVEGAFVSAVAVSRRIALMAR
ncbi:MAG TPA: FAD-dependent oxidoreductase [Archangium sp.]|uniref:NAD(P)/FAD-dependent oxidoreductase n=1 Tax=Archangium sp. TaxID=1872627 RepID=UPI002E30E867|nr:FAD-dependent oxidoreductase [Archangium sp.]HEX5745735.1 FAD-dependent oxidoreductase [Archangium sp.]